jgi:hypothetical protein
MTYNAATAGISSGSQATDRAASGAGAQKMTAETATSSSPLNAEVHRNARPQGAVKVLPFMAGFI